MVSVDKPEDNKAFAEKEQADFPILSDPEKTVANAYGVIPSNRPPERQFASRWTFYIDPQGKIAAIDKSGKTSEAGQAIIQNLTDLKVPKAKKAEEVAPRYNAARKVTSLRAVSPSVRSPSFRQTPLSTGRSGRPSSGTVRDCRVIVSVRTPLTAIGSSDDCRCPRCGAGAQRTARRAPDLSCDQLVER